MRSQQATDAQAPVVEPVPRIHPVRATFRRLCMAGLTPHEAGTLTGHLAGLRIVPGGWSIGEVERLLFVRELVRIGRIGS